MWRRYVLGNPLFLLRVFLHKLSGPRSKKRRQLQPRSAKMLTEPSRRTAVVTASYANDFERCRLMCESMDRRLQGDWVHYLLVADFDVTLFRQLEGSRRQVIDERDLLPWWLRPVTDPLSGGRRKIWLSPFGLPLRGWHVQQLRRLALARHIDEAAMFAVDSDVVFLRDFDPATLWQGRPTDALPQGCVRLTQICAPIIWHGLRIPIGFSVSAPMRCRPTITSIR